ALVCEEDRRALLLRPRLDLRERLLLPFGDFLRVLFVRPVKGPLRRQPQLRQDASDRDQREFHPEKAGNQLPDDFPRPQGRAEVELLRILPGYYPPQPGHLPLIQPRLRSGSWLCHERFRTLKPVSVPPGKHRRPGNAHYLRHRIRRNPTLQRLAGRNPLLESGPPAPNRHDEIIAHRAGHSLEIYLLIRSWNSYARYTLGGYSHGAQNKPRRSRATCSRHSRNRIRAQKAGRNRHEVTCRGWPARSSRCSRRDRA